MTSFTKKLYSRDPAAAEHFHEQQRFEHRLQYGKHTQLAEFSMPTIDTTAQRYGFKGGLTARQFNCSLNCGSLACVHGCTLRNRKRQAHS